MNTLKILPCSNELKPINYQQKEKKYLRSPGENSVARDSLKKFINIYTLSIHHAGKYQWANIT